MVLIKQSLLLVLTAGALVFGVSAQTSKRGPGQSSTQNRKPDATARQVDPKLPSSVAVERSPTQYLSGEANVAVTGNQNPQVRLGLSPNGATIIEFPAADKLFNIIPGNSNLVTVEESPTKDTDRFIVLRPGDGFASPTTMSQAGRAPVTSVIVQMTSGIVVTFLFYPVSDLSQHAHRVVVNYDRNEVVAARRAAGLAVNLDSNIEVKQPVTASVRVVPASNDARSSDGASRPGLQSAEVKKSSLVAVADEALNQGLKNTDGFGKWSKESHGLSISIAPAREVDKQSQVVVLAVRNSRKKPARLVPGQPELFVETVDSRGKSLAVDPVEKLAEQTTAVDGFILAKSTVYYAIVYKSKILGVNQRLRVAVSMTTAADDPSIAPVIDESEKRGGR